VEGTGSVVWPHYSYWTLGYMLTYRGAWKLVQQNPLSKLLPVDEYLPIMFNKHPEYDCVLFALPRVGPWNCVNRPIPFPSQMSTKLTELGFGFCSASPERNA